MPWVKTPLPPKVAPEILKQPQGAELLVGAPISLSVIARGAGLLDYQWFKDKVALEGEKSTRLERETAALEDAGVYWVTVKNEQGTRESDHVEVKVSALPVPAKILKAPGDITVGLGGWHTFRVEAAGTEPLRYQWFKDDAEIPDATGPTYTINPVGMKDQGAYRVRVSNDWGNPMSDPPATLTVDPDPTAPVILLEPEDLTVEEGGTAIFTTDAGGSEPLSYQWYYGEEPIDGATFSTLILQEVDAGKAGEYRVQVSSPWGKEFSKPATLTVVPPSAPPDAVEEARVKVR
jgi:hypothetical protein